ncbi:hypothetical protein MAPG_04539 [Magnaporthiopsis poae ATCC 64411]|uniref:GH16 domain-containing protein n=1 Tax=Magnaporthiopsis poae (strain ATCC 64411 / 73-15) TaxID=644358 RepID=A0A0C4DX03_MAGP6|nr:hypothetical protein MAPG_04539 [Magnaporthiopsis poae ATCC 64411]
MAFTEILVALLAAAGTVSAQQTYSLVKTYDKSNNFFDLFVVRDRAFFQKLGYPTGDPTSGFVNYVSREEGIKSGLIAYRGNQLYIGVDYNTTLSPKGPGRKSVRLESKTAFDNGLMLIDIQHMPGNMCGSWPAFWGYNADENPYSEIDILEGGGWPKQTSNIMSLHTCGQCSFPNLKGNEARSDCDMNAGPRCEGVVKNPAGCGLTAPKDTYGDGFNKNGGGVYAMQLNADGIKIWFHPRNKIPFDISMGKPNTTGWPNLLVNFPTSKTCNVSKIFKNLSIIINTTFCGSSIYDWKAQTDGWPQCRSAPGGTCEAYVAANPQAYKEAYWLFNYVKIYQDKKK